MQQYEAMTERADMSYAFTGMRGAIFRKHHPTISIIFNAGDVIVTKMFSQVNYSTYTSNTREISVTLLNNNLTQLAYPNGTLIPELISELKSENDDPTIEGWYEGVKGMRVKVRETNNGQPPKHFRFGVIGCYTAGMSQERTIKYLYDCTSIYRCDIYHYPNHNSNANIDNICST